MLEHIQHSDSDCIRELEKGFNKMAEIMSVLVNIRNTTQASEAYQKKGWLLPILIVTEAYPTLLLDLVEATWLVELLEGSLTMEELISYRAKFLAKHYQHVEEVRERVRKHKLR